jgi:hypothetical protein
MLGNGRRFGDAIIRVQPNGENAADALANSSGLRNPCISGWRVDPETLDIAEAVNAGWQDIRHVGNAHAACAQTASCQFQVDVRLSVGGVSKFYSGLIGTVPGCGRSGNAPRLTPGFWKNHQAQTQALLPQSLGSFVVSTAGEATAIFKAMKCSDAVDCLAGHLLSAELDVANGSSICISGVIFQANHFLMSVGYSGPRSYTITSSDRASALGFETTLDDYTSDSSSASC